MSINLSPTQRGFLRGEFTDRYGAKCSIQQSSLATEGAIWLGVNDPDLKIMARDAVAIGRDDLLNDGPERLNGRVAYPVPDTVLATTRMHLTQEQVAELLPLLIYFAENGELPYPAAANTVCTGQEPA